MTGQTEQTKLGEPGRQRLNGASAEAMLKVSDLKKHFRIGRGSLKAVDGISFEIRRGETFGLVGESGCGKSTVARVLARLYRPSAGEVLFDGEDIFTRSRSASRDLHRRMQMIFQDPQASLNPRMVIGDVIAEGIDLHGLAETKDERQGRVHELLDTVDMRKEHADRYPHEFSGGQRQRIGLARALALQPELIIADEPVSSLDVSIQAQVINLLRRLQRDRGLTYLFISHDLSVVKYIADRVGVMYLGQLVEVADSDTLYNEPLHPYTQALLSAAPTPDPDAEHGRARILLHGDVPNPVNPPSGCRFRTRCPRATTACAADEPEWREMKPGHWVFACHCVT